MFLLVADFLGPVVWYLMLAIRFADQPLEVRLAAFSKANEVLHVFQDEEWRLATLYVGHR